MKRWIAALAGALLLAGIVGAPARAQSERTTGCASHPATVITQPHFSLPEGTTFAQPYIAFDLDIGSDGRMRDIHPIVGSGNTVTDALLRAAFASAKYAAAESGCAAVSSVLRYLTNTRPEASPAPQPTPLELPRPARLTDGCAPLVDTFIFPVKRDRSKTGAATIAVPIDASGTIAGTAHIEKSTGSTTLDTEALRIASTGKYRFMDHDTCRPQPITYFLELRFQ